MLASIKKSKQIPKEPINFNSISYTTYVKSKFPAMLRIIPITKLTEFLMSKAVSNGNTNFKLNYMCMLNSACPLLCWISKADTTEKELIGMHTVGYFLPLKAAILNLTAIFKDHHGQRKLDPINKVAYFVFQQLTYYCFLFIMTYCFHKVTIEYVLKKYPEARRVMLST